MMRVGGMAEYWRGGQVRDREVAEAGLYRGFRVRGKFFRLFHVLFLVSVFTFGPSEKFISSFEGISRMICMTKSNTPLRVAIDGYEWSGVKFFQLSGQWQTHIKFCPVAVGTTQPSSEQF